MRNFRAAIYYLWFFASLAVPSAEALFYGESLTVRVTA
jgi:hypothetical protein